MRRSVIVLVLLGMFTVVPALPAAARDAGDARDARDPVLLVHGFNGSAASWHTMTDRLEAAGYPRSAIDAISYDSTDSNVGIAQQIGREVDALLARTGAKKVDVIAHSMGAISARYYVERLGGAAKVDAFVSLAGVNRGTYWAVACSVLVSCREMVPGSSLLDRLSPNVEADQPTRFAAWWSPCDPAILPPTNAELTGAHNTETACLGHSDLKTNARVFTQVLDFIDQPYTVTA
jgi:triacylglycerol lipase